jgi:hypothetical protein
MTTRRRAGTVGRRRLRRRIVVYALATLAVAAVLGIAAVNLGVA